MASSKNQQPQQLQLTPLYAGSGKWEVCGLWVAAGIGLSVILGML